MRLKKRNNNNFMILWTGFLLISMATASASSSLESLNVATTGTITNLAESILAKFKERESLKKTSMFGSLSFSFKKAAANPQGDLDELAQMYSALNYADIMAIDYLKSNCKEDGGIFIPSKDPGLCIDYIPILFKSIEGRLGMIISQYLFSDGMLNPPPDWTEHAFEIINVLKGYKENASDAAYEIEKSLMRVAKDKTEGRVRVEEAFTVPAASPLALMKSPINVGNVIQPGTVVGTVVQPAIQSMGTVVQPGSVTQPGPGTLAQPAIQPGPGTLAQPALQQPGIVQPLAQPGMIQTNGIVQPVAPQGVMQPVAQPGTVQSVVQASNPGNPVQTAYSSPPAYNSVVSQNHQGSVYQAYNSLGQSNMIQSPEYQQALSNVYNGSNPGLVPMPPNPNSIGINSYSNQQMSAMPAFERGQLIPMILVPSSFLPCGKAESNGVMGGGLAAKDVTKNRSGDEKESKVTTSVEAVATPVPPVTAAPVTPASPSVLNPEDSKSRTRWLFFK